MVQKQRREEENRDPLQNDRSIHQGVERFRC
jgi:hypothetical protein